MAMRAVEMVDPVSFYGRPWGALVREEQLALIAYAQVRMSEVAPRRAAEEDD